MADTHNQEMRSYNMSRIKSKDTKPELIVRKFLHSNGFRYRLHVKHLAGKPDLVLKKYNITIFINGCFWHRHLNCKYATVPKSNTEYWHSKFQSNIENDRKQIDQLKLEGWKVIVIWECELKPEKMKQTLKQLYDFIVTNSPKDTS